MHMLMYNITYRRCNLLSWLSWCFCLCFNSCFSFKRGVYLELAMATRARRCEVQL